MRCLRSFDFYNPCSCDLSKRRMSRIPLFLCLQLCLWKKRPRTFVSKFFSNLALRLCSRIGEGLRPMCRHWATMCDRVAAAWPSSATAQRHGPPLLAVWGLLAVAGWGLLAAGRPQTAWGLLAVGRPKAQGPGRWGPMVCQWRGGGDGGVQACPWAMCP